MSEEYGTRDFTVEEAGGSWAVRDRKFGGLQCYRPDANSAQRTAERLELTGKFGHTFSHSNEEKQ